MRIGHTIFHQQTQFSLENRANWTITVAGNGPGFIEKYADWATFSAEEYRVTLIRIVF
jgi:hypothetical protein